MKNNLTELDKVIIFLNAKSLGDWIMICNLPEALYRKYGIYTYLSLDNEFYSEDTYEVLFADNPYIKGKTDEPYNTFIECRNPEPNKFMADIYFERFGLEIMESRIPKLYSCPKTDNRIQNKNSVLFCMDCRSYGVRMIEASQKAFELLTNIVNEFSSDVYLVSYNNPDKTITRLTPPPNKFKFTVLDIDNVMDYLDIVNSVKYFIGMSSGTSLLASSIKEYYNKELEVNLFSPAEGDGRNFNPLNCNIIYF